MPRPITYPNIFGTLSGTVSASLLDQNWQVDQSIFNDSAAGWVNVGVDTGSVNSYIVTLNPAPSGYLNGFFLSFVPLNTNTGPSSVNVNGLGNVQILTLDGSALGPQKLQTGVMYTMVCINGTFRVISPDLNVLVGEIRMTGSLSVIPANWLGCNGQNVSRTQYSALFAAIGTAYGVGDGSNTFTLPNFQSRFPIHGSPGQLGGASSVALGVGNLPSHNHGINDPGHIHNITDPGHQHTYVSPTTATSSSGISVFGASTAQQLTTTGTTGTGIGIISNVTGISTQATGSGAAFSIMPPYLGVVFIIRAY